MEKVFAERLGPLVESCKNDPESVYNTWFVGSEARLKAFRSIRRGVEAVVRDIQTGRFPNDFKGSSLEFVLACITEQKQVFEDAAHPFFWKPKLRIPDIYENGGNQQAFGQFLFSCLNAGQTGMPMHSRKGFAVSVLRHCQAGNSDLEAFATSARPASLAWAAVRTGGDRCAAAQERAGRRHSCARIGGGRKRTNATAMSVASEAMAGFWTGKTASEQT